MGFFDKLKNGMTKTKKNFSDKISGIFSFGRKIDDDFYDELEENLILSDVGVATSMDLVAQLRARAKEQKITEMAELRVAFEELVTAILTRGESGITLAPDRLNIIMVVGVNGAGKTTSIGKMAHYFKSLDKKVLLAAADTFRAAAIEQLCVWGQRSGVDVIKQTSGSDPGAVVFDAVRAAIARHSDVLIVDTAGRLQNKSNLMEELKKIGRIIEREAADAKVEVLLVLDSGTGQNGLSQAKLFAEAAPLTGIILTKLDGTAKGGVVLGIQNELELPVRLIGVGEGIDDLQTFNAADFAGVLFGGEAEQTAEED